MDKIDDLPAAAAAMEGTTEVKDLLTKIRPPRLEDAGLEDCALSPESIKEAFLKAASAVGSRPSIFFSADESDDESDTENVQAYVGITEVEELKGDVMVPIGSDQLKKKEEEEEACVDGLKSLKIDMKIQKGKH